MSTVRIRPRSSIADPELARRAVVDLPRGIALHRPHLPTALVQAVDAVRGPILPERVIVMPLVPVPAEIRRR